MGPSANAHSLCIMWWVPVCLMTFACYLWSALHQQKRQQHIQTGREQRKTGKNMNMNAPSEHLSAETTLRTGSEAKLYSPTIWRIHIFHIFNQNWQNCSSTEECGSGFFLAPKWQHALVCSLQMIKVQLTADTVYICNTWNIRFLEIFLRPQLQISDEYHHKDQNHLSFNNHQLSAQSPQ